jgi:hypothetical protein
MKFLQAFIILCFVLTSCSCGHINYNPKYDGYTSFVEYEASIRIFMTCANGLHGTGSGVAISPRYALTAAHVATGCEMMGSTTMGLVVETVSGRLITASVDKTEDGIDAVRLVLDGTNEFTTWAEVSTRTPYLGEPLCVVAGDSMNIHSIKKCGFMQSYEDPMLGDYGISAPVVPGNSGGPVFDAEGHVVGLVRTWRGGMSLEPLGGFVPASKFPSLLRGLFQVNITTPDASTPDSPIGAIK